MIIARAPVRISLAGGGTDLPAYYERFGGAVVSTTINKYFYVFLNVAEEDALQISSSDFGTFYRHDDREQLLWDGDLRLPRAILSSFGIERGLSMFLASEVPPGTGLGSSSAVAVAVTKAVATALGLSLGNRELAEIACHIELEKLGEPIGKQDQYAAAHGGLNWIVFNKETVKVKPLRISKETIRNLERHLLLFFTGSSRSASEILKRQTESSRRQDSDVIAALHSVKAIAGEMRRALEEGKLDTVGSLMHRNWVQKKQFAKGVSNPKIDEMYDLACAAGAKGGKITGAGGGGFLMLFCAPDCQEAVTQALQERSLKKMDFRFDHMGARILMNAGLRIPIDEYPATIGVPKV